MRFVKSLIAVLSALIVSSASANVIVNANTAGWCASQTYGCNNSFGSNMVVNSFVGWEAPVQFNNFLTFHLPSTSITNATLYIHSVGVNALDPLVEYAIQEATAQSFAGLMGGTILGTINLQTAISYGYGNFAPISMNSAGLAALNANLGSSFTFGGTLINYLPSSVFTYDQVYGFNVADSNGVIAYLSINDAVVSEPAAPAIFLTGLALLGMIVGRRKG